MFKYANLKLNKKKTRQVHKIVAEREREVIAPENHALMHHLITSYIHVIT